MRRILFLLLASALWAGPEGSPAAPRVLGKGFFIPSKCWVNVRAGYEGDFVFDAEMKQEEEGSGSVDKYSQMTNSGEATMNLLERLDLYGIFGTSRVCSQWRFTDMGGRVRNAQMESAHNFLWAIGLRAILYEWENWTLGFGGRYSASHNHLTWFTLDGVNASVSASHFRWREWQFNLGVSYQIDLFTPYIGVNYLNARTLVSFPSVPIADQNARRDHLVNRIPVGINLGCTLSTGQYFMLNVEARLIAEEAATVSGDFRF